MADATTKGEWNPLPVWLYNLVQRVANHGTTTRYLPERAALLDWEKVPDSQILEVGCGTGLFPSRGVASDLDERRVRVVIKQGRRAVVADGRQLPFLSGSFSLVYCEGVLHHIDDAGAVALVKEMLRVCRAEGRAVVLDSVWPKSPLRVPAWILRAADFGRHVRTEAHLREVLRMSGGELRSAKRVTYTTIGLEALLSVLVPAGSRSRSPDFPSP